MRTEDLNYELPVELIAQEPAKSRTESRLLVLNRSTGELIDRIFADIVDYIEPGDCLVLNDTKVLPARFFARRATGARLEGLFLHEPRPGQWQVMLKNSRKVKIGEQIILIDRNKADWHKVTASERYPDGRWLLEIPDSPDAEEVLSQIGTAPLPPYIKRNENDNQTQADMQRYQTVYARQMGAVAAPTAGLHFTKEMLANLTQKGVQLAYVTLHVGAGTFKPVTTDNLDDHKMHFEAYELAQKDADKINKTIENRRRIIAVGTTSVRTLETIAKNGPIIGAHGQTDLFIQPGYQFKVVNTLITNFHLPKSTLLALVGAFAGMENVLKAYRHAIEHQYRFFSYGDAMLIV